MKGHIDELSVPRVKRHINELSLPRMKKSHIAELFVPRVKKSHIDKLAVPRVKKGHELGRVTTVNFGIQFDPASKSRSSLKSPGFDMYLPYKSSPFSGSNCLIANSSVSIRGRRCGTEEIHSNSSSKNVHIFCTVGNT